MGAFLNYLLEKKGPHSIHSPFIYDFSTKVLQNHVNLKGYATIEKARKEMFSNRNVIETVDFGSGAGEKQFSTYRARVSQLAKARSSHIRYYKLLHRITEYFKPETMLEFGTSTGLSAISLATGNPTGRLITMEGCASVSHVASSLLSRLKVDNVEYAIGDFNHLLAANLESVEQLDLVFFDGNHRKEPTLNYFHHCLTKAGENSIFIFDDIHWSADMEEAWIAIQKHEQVTLSVDLFQFGIVFFRKGVEKQHFVLSM